MTYRSISQHDCSPKETNSEVCFVAVFEVVLFLIESIDGFFEKTNFFPVDFAFKPVVISAHICLRVESASVSASDHVPSLESTVFLQSMSRYREALVLTDYMSNTFNNHHLTGKTIILEEFRHEVFIMT